MTEIDELRPLSAGRLLGIRRETAGEDALERAALCNARVLAETCFHQGERVFADEQAVLAALDFREMETLLRRLAERRELPPAAAVNPTFDSGRFQRLREE